MNRKERMWAVACAELALPLMYDRRSAAAVKAAAAHLAGELRPEDLAPYFLGAPSALSRSGHYLAWCDLAWMCCAYEASNTDFLCWWNFSHPTDLDAAFLELKVCCLGSCAAAEDPTARNFAKYILATEDYGALPVLADLLEDGGFSDELALLHLRGSLSHCKYCYVLGALCSE